MGQSYHNTYIPIMYKVSFLFLKDKLSLFYFEGKQPMTCLCSRTETIFLHLLFLRELCAHYKPSMNYKENAFKFMLFTISTWVMYIQNIVLVFGLNLPHCLNPRFSLKENFFLGRSCKNASVKHNFFDLQVPGFMCTEVESREKNVFFFKKYTLQSGINEFHKFPCEFLP